MIAANTIIVKGIGFGTHSIDSLQFVLVFTGYNDNGTIYRDTLVRKEFESWHSPKGDAY